MEDIKISEITNKVLVTGVLDKCQKLHKHIIVLSISSIKECHKTGRGLRVHLDAALSLCR